MSGSQGRKSSDKIFNSESISNLTKPQLFSLYDEDITNPTESNSLYQIVNDSKLKSTQDKVQLSNDNSTLFQKLIHFIFSLFVLGVSGIIYLEISQNLHDNHQLHSSFTSKPVIVINKIIKWVFNDNIPLLLQHEWIIYAIEGILWISDTNLRFNFLTKE